MANSPGERVVVPLGSRRFPATVLDSRNGWVTVQIDIEDSEPVVTSVRASDVVPNWGTDVAS